MLESAKVIPGFPNYIMTPDGSVYRRDNGRKLKPYGSGNRRLGYYALFVNGVRYNRSERVLYQDTYGDPQEVRRDRDGEWRRIREFPDYEMNSFGFIRNRETRYESKVQVDENNVHFVRLSRGGKRYRRSEESLMLATFPEMNDWENM